MPGSHWDWVSCGPKKGPPPVVLGLETSWNINCRFKLRTLVLGSWLQKQQEAIAFGDVCIIHNLGRHIHVIQKLYTSDCNGNARMWHSWWWIRGLKISQNDPTTFHVNVTCNCMTWACFWCFFFLKSFCWHSLAASLEHRRRVISSGCRPIFLTWFVAI